MDDSLKADFGVAVSAMFEAFGQEVTTPRLLGYWIGLRDLELPIVEAVVAKAIRDCKHLPTPSELREFAGHTSASDRAVLAWNDVLRAVPYGPYKHIDFEDPCCNAAIRMLGGWPGFVARFSDVESEKWARLDFLKTYQSISQAGVDGDVSRPLPGLAEVQSSGGKVISFKPVRIGCDASRRLLADARNDAPRLKLRSGDTHEG